MQVSLELRKGISEHLQRLYGVEYDCETEVWVTVGVSEALSLGDDGYSGAR